jgi:hypothetical protein
VFYCVVRTGLSCNPFFFLLQPDADPDKPETLLIVAREFRAAVRMAGLAAGLLEEAL